MLIRLVKLKDYNDALGSEEGDFSGTDYFKNVFDNILKESLRESKCIVIDASNTYGVPHTFLRKLIELSIDKYGIGEIRRTIYYIYDENTEETKRLNDLLRAYLWNYK